MGLAPPPLINNNQRATNMPLPSTSKPTGHYDSPARPASPAYAYEMGEDSASDLSDNNNESPQVEQLLMNHLRFAHAFRKNDAAMILQYLAKDVTLVSVDGARHEGQSAVLAYLVGARMTKLSANLHVKGCPTRSGTCQSTFIYEHGIVFKDPLFMEVLDWKPNSATIVRIAHIALPDAKSGKTPQDFGKSSPLRLSFGNRMSDDDSSEYSGDSDGSETWESDNNNNNDSTPPPVKVRCRRLKSNSSADSNAAMTAVTAASLRLSSSSSSSQSGANEIAVQPMAPCAVASGAKKSMPMITLAEISCTGLTPIRKRKTVNPFVLIQCPEVKAVWKSPVMRRDPNPKWNHIPLKIPVHKPADVVEISLWDHTFFRSVKVAGAALVVADLLKDDSEFSTTIQLERFDAARTSGEPQYVTLQLRFVRPCGGDMAIRSSDEVEQNPAQEDEIKSKGTGMTSSALSAGVKWLMVDPFVDSQHASVLLMLIRAAIVAAIVWMLFHATLVWPIRE
ncbi:hypothetical protein P3T76_011159 [Phytophthora citrophthora]|uniref:C2 domain-containing protein n=1 Tax=Phytophthora citrophthora TaxID=4793 RepID=A0AAD9LFE0_9STRA|nr:hypothetical protein P3T76_011159 [Phytophthora citrophthora]